MPDAQVFFVDNLERLGPTLYAQQKADPIAYNLYNGLRYMAAQLSEIQSELRAVHWRLDTLGASRND